MSQSMPGEPRWASQVRRVIRRQTVDDALDRFRLWFDTFPHGVYQPVPEVSRGRPATREEGSVSRWQAMEPIIERLGAGSAVDVGPAMGYFTLQLAGRGIPTVAVEGDQTNVRITTLAIRRRGLENAGVLNLQLTPGNVELVPPTDCLLFLSVWHHLVRWHGLDSATRMLQVLWERTRRVMFFDTGEDEMSPEFRLPDMQPDPRTWLERYLAETCEGAGIEHLGLHDAFDAEGRPTQRNLFAVTRQAG